MQFITENSKLQYLLVLVAIYLSVSNALLCTTCLDRESCANRPETEVCTDNLVTLHHRLLQSQNPNIAGAVPSGGYKCYDLDMSYESDLTGSTVLVEQKGCTFNTTIFCDGWSNTTSVKHCTTCDDRDECNKNQTEGSTTPQATTITTLAPTTTTAGSTSTVASTSSLTTIVSSSSTSSANQTTSTVAATSSSSTAASSSTVTTPNETTSTQASTTASVKPPTTTPATTVSTSKPAGTSACVASWVAVLGIVLLHGLVGLAH